MIITDNRTNATTTFQDINKGDVFFSPETEKVYMKCTYCDVGEDEYNAIDLHSGRLVYFDDVEEIEKVIAQLTITNP